MVKIYCKLDFLKISKFVIGMLFCFNSTKCMMHENTIVLTDTDM